MTGKRFKRGRGIFIDYPSETIIDTETNERYYDGIKPNYKSSKEICDLLNDQSELIQELYDFRLVYNALLFNEWFKNDVCEVYKSMKHYDGEPCFDGEWFIVVAILPTGKQITNHYNIQDWDLFQIPEYPQVKDTFDGHTSKDVLKRLREIILK